jgi:hypothetical protein
MRAIRISRRKSNAALHLRSVLSGNRRINIYHAHRRYADAAVALQADPPRQREDLGILKALFANLGGTAIAGSPTDFGMLITDETEKWGKVIRAANIKAE